MYLRILGIFSGWNEVVGRQQPILPTFPRE